MNGAYGFRVEGVDLGPWLAVQGGEGWPVLTVERAGVGLDVDPDELRAELPDGAGEDEIVHPLLGTIALRLAERRGIDALHAGAVVGAAGAWAVAGPKEHGKSTLLGACAHAGMTVLCDDVLVLERGRCLAGPRMVDLRPGAAEALAAGERARGGSRRRMLLPRAPASVELAGFVHLRWGDELQLAALDVSQRLDRLAVLRALSGWPRLAELPIELAHRPAFELTRPRDWGRLGETVALLGEAVSAPAAPSARAIAGTR